MIRVCLEYKMHTVSALTYYSGAAVVKQVAGRQIDRNGCIPSQQLPMLASHFGSGSAVGGLATKIICNYLAAPGSLRAKLSAARS